MTQIDAAKPAANADSPFLKTEVLELYQPVVEGMTKYSGALCDGYMAMGAEWLAFVNRRLHVDISLQGRLATCHNPQDLFQEWASFMGTAAEDYRTEFARLAEMNATASQKAVSAVHTNGEAKPH